MKFRLKKAGAQTQFADFDKRPSWNDLALKIASLFHIPSPKNVGVAFVERRTVETVEDEDELQKFYDEHPYDPDFKFVVQDTTARDAAITETWSKGSNLSKSGSNQLKRTGAPDIDQEESKKPRIDKLPLEFALGLPSESALNSLHERLQQIDPNNRLYSDPRNMIHFPFPFIGGQLPVDRFDFRESHFKYMGRTAFSKVMDTIKELKIGGFSRLYISGTMGYGKSHILAVLTGLLSRAGKRVVYLPDSRELVVNMMRYMQTALLCAFADPRSSDVRDEIRALKSKDDVIALCAKHPDAYFIIDQMNALDYEGTNMDTVDDREKAAVRLLLDNLTSGQYRITSASANHKTAMHMASKQRGEKKLALMGGMSEDEMNQWWIHHKKKVPIFKDNDKARIEDLTGRIPLLLCPLLQFAGKPFHEIEQGFWRHDDLAAVRQNIVQFAAEKRAKESENYEQFYLSAILACLTASSVSSFPNRWLDHRYFYDDKGPDQGKCTCGLARQAAAIIIRHGSPGLLCGDTWIRSLRTFKNNPSMVGFLVEQTCLSAISAIGFHYGSITWESSTATTFKGDILSAIPAQEDCEKFFIPEDPFFKDIDALYLKVTAKEKRVWVVPIQVTVAKTHKDSEKAFYSRWESDWQEFFGGYELKTNFVWIVEDKQSWQRIEEEIRTTRKKLKLISPEHEQIVVAVKDLKSSLGNELARIRQQQ